MLSQQFQTVLLTCLVVWCVQYVLPASVFYFRQMGQTHDAAVSKQLDKFGIQEWDAITSDRFLQEAYKSLLIFAADVSTQFQPNPQTTSDRTVQNTDDSTQLHSRSSSDPELDNAKRGLVDSITNGINTIGDLITGKKNITDVAGDALSGSLGDLFSSITGSLDGPALYLGTGLGIGALQGLNMSSPATETSIVSRIASANGVEPTGINKVVEQAGIGVTAAILPAIKLPDIGGDLGPAVFALGEGIGTGTASGLNLTKKRAVASNGSGLPNILRNFGGGLSLSIAQGINLSELTGSLATKNPLGSMNISEILVPAASGLGKGLGQGVAIGLGLQADSDIQPLSVDSKGELNIEGVTESFSKGLSSRFLANNSLGSVFGKKAATTGEQQVSSGGLSLPSMGSVSIGKIAEGLARGLIGGAATEVQAAGGLDSFLSQSTSVPSTQAKAVVTDDVDTNFNDTVGGAATGFGRGLGGEGIKVIGTFLRKDPATVTSNTSQVSRKRSLHVEMQSSDLQLPNRLPPSATSRKVGILRRDVTSIIEDINPAHINALVQTGLGALQCEGVGGIAGVLRGLSKSKTISTGLLTSGDDSKFLPDLNLTLTNDRNTYDIGIKQLSIAVNGLPITRFIIITAFHVVFVIIAYLIALPVLLGMQAALDLRVMLGGPRQSTRLKRWQNIIEYFGFFLMGMLGIILGCVGMGNSWHFRTAHGILGLITLVMTIIYAGFSVAVRRKPRKSNLTDLDPLSNDSQAPRSIRSIQTGIKSKMSLSTVNTIMAHFVLAISNVTLFTGFMDLSSFSLCIVQVLPISVSIMLGSSVTTLWSAVMGILGIQWWLKRQLQKQHLKEQEDQSEPKPVEPKEPKSSGISQLSTKLKDLAASKFTRQRGE